MKKRYSNKSLKGFTLIEVLLYVGLVAMILLAILALLSMALQSRIKNQAMAEIEQQGMQVIQIITQTIRNAEDINSPSQGTSASSLSLDVVSALEDPTIFDLSSGAIRITEGVGSATPLTNSRVTALDLNFEDLSYTDTFGIARVEFTLEHINPEGRSEYNYSKTFYGSASLRQ